MNDHPENTEQAQEESTSPQATEPSPKKPICKLSIISAIPLILFIPAFFLIGFFERSDNKIAEILIPIFGSILLFGIFVSPFIAIIAKFRIALSDGRLRGNRLTNFVIVGSSILLFLGAITPTMGRVKKIAQRVVCGTNLKGLGTALVVYANEYDDRLPTATEWCDLLITHADVSPKSFVCPSSDDVHGECSYALNKYAVGKKISELPASMILLFETNIGRSENKRECLLKERGFLNVFPGHADKNPKKHKVHKDRWNQVGGPEDLMTAHDEGSNFTFADGHNSFERTGLPSQLNSTVLEYLRWDLKKTQFTVSDYLSISEVYSDQSPNPSFPKSVIVLGVLVISLSMVIIVLTKPWKYPLFVVKLTIGAIIIAFLLGAWVEAMHGALAQAMYRKSYWGFGTCSSIVLAILASLCYIGILMKIQRRLCNEKSINQLSVSLGLVFGMICSILLHVTLFLIHRETDGIAYMLAGIPFGFAGGAILGAISGRIICKYYRPQTTEPITETGETE